MIQALTKNYTLQIFLFVLLPILLWIPVFIIPPSMYEVESFAPFYTLIYDAMADHPQGAVVLALLFLFIQGVFFQYILVRNELLPKLSFLPALFYVVAFSFTSSLQTLSPFLFLSFFLLVLLYYFFEAYSSKKAFDCIFNACFSIGLSLLFCPGSWLLVLLIPLVIFIYKSFQWRIWLLSFLGFCAPYLVLAMYYFFVDKGVEEFSLFMNSISIKIPLLVSYDNFLELLIGVFSYSILLLLITIIFSRYHSGTIVDKKKISIFAWVCLFCFVISLTEGLLPLKMTYLSFLVSFGYTNLLFLRRRKFLVYFAFYLFIVLIISNKLIYLL